MARRVRSPLSPVLRHLRFPREGFLAGRHLARELISVAGLLGEPVFNADGSLVGTVVDLVARWGSDTYPPLTGLVAKVGRRRTFVHIDQINRFEQTGMHLGSARMDLVDFVRRDGEVVLAGDVIDHQLVDIDGVQVIRASDLYVAEVAGTIRLVGVDVTLQTLLRRLGPRRFRSRATPGRVIDWSVIQPFGGAGSTVRLSSTQRELRRLRPSDLADLLEELGRFQRQELLDALDEETAADVLEELDEDDVVRVMRDTGTERAAALLSAMQPDEAADALRELTDREQSDLLAAIAPERAVELRSLLSFRPDSAGGLMTPVIVAVGGEVTVTDVRSRLREHHDHSSDIDGALVVDADGRVLDDVSLFELLLAEPAQRMLELVGEPWPVTVTTDASVSEVLDALVDNRRSSVVVVDDGRPIGRILADDLLDAVAVHRRSPFTRMPT